VSEWLLQRGKGKTIGPFSTEDIVDGVRAGEIPEDTFVSDPGAKGWIPLRDVAAFAEALEAKRSGAAAGEAVGKGAAKGAGPSLLHASAAPDVAVVGNVAEARPSATPARSFGTAPEAGARRPLRVAFGAATVRGRVRLVAAAGALLALGAADLGLGRSSLGLSLFDAFREVRDASMLAAAGALVGAVGVVVGRLRDRDGDPAGSAWARGATLIAALAAAVASSLALAAVRASTPLALAARRLVLVASGTQLVVAALALALVWPAFRVPTRGRAAALSQAALVALTAVIALGALGARLSALFDVLYVCDPLDAPAFADADSLARWLDAERLGPRRLAEAAALLAPARPLPCEARVRFVRELPREGGEPLREVELLDGPGRGARVFVARRATSPVAQTCR
jgi:hypothetical protein